MSREMRPKLEGRLVKIRYRREGEPKFYDDGYGTWVKGEIVNFNGTHIFIIGEEDGFHIIPHGMIIELHEVKPKITMLTKSDILHMIGK